MLASPEAAVNVEHCALFICHVRFGWRETENPQSVSGQGWLYRDRRERKEGEGPHF